MEEKIKVSIICDTYNHERYIRKCLDGFMMQKTDFLFEVLVHDDASTDGTREIIQEYVKKYPGVILPIYQKRNLYSKRVKITNRFQNCRARGEYVAYCEGDDYWTDPCKLQKQADFLDAHKEYVGCTHRYSVVDENDDPQDIHTFGEYENSGAYTLKDFEKEELPGQMATYFFRNLYADPKTEYPEELLGVKYVQGDIKLILYYLMHGDIYKMNDVMSVYRFVKKSGGASWTSRASKDVGRNYGNWKGLRKIERIINKLYGVKVDMRWRKVKAAICTVSDFYKHKSLKSFFNAVTAMTLQKDALKTFLKNKK